MITIGITGTSGAGKGTVVDYLVKNNQFTHYSVGKYLKDELIKKRQGIDRDNQIKLANILRTKYGPDYIVTKLYNQAKSRRSNAIIESIRNTKEAEFIKKQKDSFLIAVDADPKTRYQRIHARKSEKDHVSFTKFILQEKGELKSKDPNSQHLLRCISLADYKIENNVTLKTLYAKIDGIMKIIKRNSAVNNYKRPPWDNYFLEIVNAVSKRGTCDRGRAGTVIVKDKQILVTGYVGSPAGFPHCDEVGHQMKTTIHEDGSKSQHCVRTVHAEQNAICQAAKRGINIEGSTIYTKMTPCRVCAMLLINCGIKRVYAERKYHAGKESEEMFKKAKVKIEYKYNKVEQYKNQ